MTVRAIEYRKGIRKSSPIASCTVAATSVGLYTLPTARTCVVRKVVIFNNNAAPTIVQIGTGSTALGTFVQQLPAWYAVNGQDLEITEDQIPNVEFTANLTVQASVAAVAPNNIQVQVEIEEYQGPTA